MPEDHAADIQLVTRAGEERSRPYGLPLAVLAEVTHRCPLQCPYCSNPVAMEPASNELPTQDWLRVIAELADLGVLQIHFSGGEPTARRDLGQMIARSTVVGL